MKYLVVSTAVTDEIWFPDSAESRRVIGGAGVYALSGMKIWTDDVTLVTGVGEDFHDLYGDWFARNRLPTEGLTVKGAFTPRTTIRYFADGDREETPVYGPDHYRSMEPTPEDVAHHCAGAAGIYVFRNADWTFWQRMIRLKEFHGFRLMWEISADAAQAGNLERVRSVARHVDVFSINRKEACNLFNTDQIGEAIVRLQSLDVPLVYLRKGKEGALIIEKDRVYDIPSVADAKVVDETGAGNSSSGAVLCGFCENRAPVMSGIMGSVSAALCIAQFGPPETFDEKLRERAARMAEKLSERMEARG